MLNVLLSLSIFQAVGIVAVLSAILMAGLWRRAFGGWNWLIALVVPLLVSYVVYWSPVWLGADDLEYGAWSGIIIVPFYPAGAVASAIVVLLFGSVRK